MRSEYLEYFLEVVNSKSFNKASQQLNITHQTISSSITNLENELDVQLVIRDKQGITLTPAGIAAVKYAQTILENTADFKQAMTRFSAKASQPTPSGHLNVLVSPLINCFVLPHIVVSFLRKYPEVTLHFNEMENVKIIGSLLNHNGDFGLFVLTHTITNDKDLCAHVMPLSNHNVHLHAFMTTQHPLAKFHSISPETLLKYPLVLYKISNSPEVVQNFLAKYGEPNIFLATDNISVYKECIYSGQAIGILARLDSHQLQDLNKEVPNSISVPIENDTIFRPLSYAFAPNLPPEKQELCQLLIDELLTLL